MKKYFVFKFTLVHRFNLERIDDVYSFGYNLVDATRHLRKLFPVSYYDVLEVSSPSMSKLVIVGYSNYSELI